MGSTCSTTSRRNIIVPQRLSQDRMMRNKNQKNGADRAELEKLKSREGDLAQNPEIEKLYQVLDSKELMIGEYFLRENSTYNETERKQVRDKNDKKWKIKKQKSNYEQTNAHDLYSHITDYDLGEFILAKPGLYTILLKKGPPMIYRYGVWKNFLTPEKYYVKSLFEKLAIKNSSNEPDIKKDVNRTFTHQKFFSNQTGQDLLYVVLKAISIYFPNVGYCQSMNFLAAMFLLVGNGNCAEAFWMFVSLLRDQKFLLMGFFEKNFPLLDFYIQLFKSLLQARLPKLYEHIEGQQLPDALWIYKWFLTIYCYSVPLADSVRIWDFVLQEGLLSMIRLALGLIKYLEADIIKLDTMGIDNLFKFLNKESLESQIMHNEDPSKKIAYSFKKLNIEKVIMIARNFKISNKEIEAFATNYEKQNGSKVPELYLKYFKNYTNYQNKKVMEEYQQEIDNYLKLDEGVVPEEASSQINVNVFLKN